MKPPAYARIAAWNVIADLELPAGTKVTVDAEAVTIHLRGGRQARAPYSPEDTPSSVYDALKDALQATAQDPH